jgi:hypothetical protein
MGRLHACRVAPRNIEIPEHPQGKEQKKLSPWHFESAEGISVPKPGW